MEGNVVVGPLKVLDLFSGIGGFSLGLESTGEFETKQFVEIDKFCQKVLKKHWPHIPIHDDIKTFKPTEYYDVICGGFPCQDISVAGKGLGLEGERSGLWKEYKRIIEDVGPKWIIIENVSALRSRGLVTVLKDLCEIGYDAEWHTVPASIFRSVQRRERVWIIAYPSGTRGKGLLSGTDFEAVRQGWVCGSEDLQTLVNDPFKPYRWPEPLIRGVDARVPNRMDRLKSLGNSVVPQIVEFIERNLKDKGIDLYERQVSCYPSCGCFLHGCRVTRLNHVKGYGIMA